MVEVVAKLRLEIDEAREIVAWPFYCHETDRPTWVPVPDARLFHNSDVRCPLRRSAVPVQRSSGPISYSADRQGNRVSATTW